MTESSLYTNAKKMVNHDLTDRMYQNIIDYFLVVIQRLANENTSSISKQYRIIRYCSYDKEYKSHFYGVNINRIRFKASNPYELWLKIYKYIQSNEQPSKRFDKENQTLFENITPPFHLLSMYHTEDIKDDFCEAFDECGNDYDAMVKVIQNSIDQWNNHENDLCWQEDEDYIVI